MSFRPIVAVSAAVRGEAGAQSARLRSSYLSALENARLVPIAAPPLRDLLAAESLLRRIDGLVLTGGADLNPAMYAESPHPALGSVSDSRDAWERALILGARQLGTPLLAICRGAQMLNVALGGSLIQDLPSQRPGSINHDPDLPRTSRSHSVEVAAESRLGRATGVTRLDVNSIHHQSINRVADTLRIVATATDGVIEGVETGSDSPWWCVGVQWHPEELVGTSEAWDRDIFAAFAEVVSQRVHSDAHTPLATSV